MVNIKINILIFLIVLPYCFSEDLLTVAEKSNYTQTSLYEDVINFIKEIQKKNNQIYITELGYSAEDKLIPLVIASKEGIKSVNEMKAFNKQAILIMANIHAGEIEGKEATQMLIRDIAYGKIKNVLENQVILFLPIFNVDGNDKLGHNRRDNGPELAGVRHNGQNLDLNRDYIKLESPEIIALVKLMNEWDPVLIVDMHTTNGSYHREPITYTTAANVNTDKEIMKYMWDKMFPAVSKSLKEIYGYDSIPYGNFIDRFSPEKGWINDSLEARYGTNYVGLRNRFAILDENYSYADYKTRVLASYAFILTILEYTNNHINEMVQNVREADIRTIQTFTDERFGLEYKQEKMYDIVVKSYEFMKEKIKPEDKNKYPPWMGDYIVKPTEKLKDYKIPYFCNGIATRDIHLKEGYIIMPYQDDVVKNLKAHGIILEVILEEYKTVAENFVINKLELDKNLYQGRVAVKVNGNYREVEIMVPKGAYYVSMRQPLARLVATLLEPDHMDSLLSWGFFNRVLVKQWTNEILPYPVYRVNERPNVATLLK